MRGHSGRYLPVPGTCEVWSAVRRTPGALALYALVTVFLVGATTAFVTFNKTVTISVDGESREVSSFARQVGTVLEAAGVEYGPRDMVVPAPNEPLGSDARIVVTHARKLRLTLDGEKSTVWVTANTVSEALRQVGVNARGAELSASRSQRLPLSGFELQVRTPRTITIKVAGNKLESTTTALTVRKALAQAGIRLGPHDKTSADLDARPKEGQVVKVMQVLGKPEKRTIALDYETVRKKNPDMYEGESSVAQEGREGVKKVTVATILHQGQRVEKVIADKVIRKPRKKIVEYGTKKRETDPQGGSAPVVESVADLNWDALAECESGGNPDAVNPAGPYYGLYQFSLPTWQSVGGEGVPTDASAAEQTYYAQKLYQRSSDEQWPVCGERLYS